jgi:TldD protein
MKNTLEIAKQIILEPADLADRQLEILLGHLLGPHIDGGDLYFQAKWNESYALEDGIIRHGAFSIQKGVGARAISGEKTGFSFCEDIVMPELLQAAKAAKSIARSQGNHTLAISPQKIITPLYPHLNPMQSITDQEKIEILTQINERARHHPLIKKVSASLMASYEVILIINQDGQLAADIRPLVRLNVSVLAEKNGRRESGYYGGGARLDYRYFLENHRIEAYVDEAIRLACLNLDAIPAPAGMMPVILGSGWPGVLLHEAIGHGLEGDFIRKKTSAFTDKLGQRVATPLCTVVDDGTLLHRRGSLTIDDEGTPTQSTLLIEKGILKGYLYDNLNAKLMNTQSTGNGRRESYAHLPLPRMTNTYMQAGPHTRDEMIASVKRGIYAVNFDGGQVDITSGQFVFSTSEAYLIEDGKITRPVKGATLIGNGPDILTKVSMVGNDLALDSGIGSCGKEGQSVPVGVGQPTLKIDEITVGGTEVS